jgi:hypothetical protein
LVRQAEPSAPSAGFACGDDFEGCSHPVILTATLAEFIACAAHNGFQG